MRPAHREKKRYIVYEVQSKDSLDLFKLQEQLVAKLKEMLGVFDGAQAGLMPIKIDKEQHKGIIRVSHNMVDKVRACFVLIKELDGHTVSISTKRVSGILKKAKSLEGFVETTKRK